MKQLKLWKRNAIVLAIVLFVCGAVYMNWFYNQQDAQVGKTLGEAALVGGKATTEEQGTEETPEATKTNSAYFSEARLNRQQARASALSLLQEAAKDEKATNQPIDNATGAHPTRVAHQR